MEHCPCRFGETLIENYKKIPSCVSPATVFGLQRITGGKKILFLSWSILPSGNKRKIYPALWKKTRRKYFVLHDNNIKKKSATGTKSFSARLGRDGGLVTVSKQSGIIKGVISVYNK
jgi:hypothetical protein